MWLKEYTILIRYGTAIPFMSQNFSSLIEAKLNLYDMVALEEERGRVYYVDNDFFKNKYTTGLHGTLKYMCIKERTVTDWTVYKENEEKTEDNNLVFFNDLRKKSKKVLTK